VTLFAGLPLDESAASNITRSVAPVPEGPPERHSPALIVLKVYRRRRGGAPSYSTSPTPPSDCEGEGKPLCRVWQVPGKVLTMDWKANPQEREGK